MIKPTYIYIYIDCLVQHYSISGALAIDIFSEDPTRDGLKKNLSASLTLRPKSISYGGISCVLVLGAEF